MFEHKAWGCSAIEVERRHHGFAGAQLGSLLNGAGFFHHAHRADDCHALIKILTTIRRRAGACGAARASPKENGKAVGRAVAVRSEGCPETSRLQMERRQPRSWYIDVGEAAVNDEIAFLKAEIYLREIALACRR